MNNKIKNSNPLSSNDVYSINLLNSQAFAFLIMMCASYILYISTCESISLIDGKFSNDQAPNPDISGINGANLLLFSQTIITFVANTQYNDKLSSLNNNESIFPEYYFNLGSIFALIGDALTVIGAKALFNRNSFGPIIGE